MIWWIWGLKHPWTKCPQQNKSIMMKKNKAYVYLSGRIRNFPDYKSIFRQAENQLRALGYENIFNPADKSEKSLRDAFAQDMEWICRHATHIAMFWNCAESKGAIAEYHFARALKLPVIFLKEPKPKSHLKIVSTEASTKEPIACI